MLWFLSSYTMYIMGNQAPNSLSYADNLRNNHNNDTTHNGSNTFLINEKQRYNITTTSQPAADADGNAGTGAVDGHLAGSSNEQLNALFDSLNVTQRINHTGKFIFIEFLLQTIKIDH